MSLWHLVVRADCSIPPAEEHEVVAVAAVEGRDQVMLVKAERDAADWLRQDPAVRSVEPARDDIYVDTATRTSWLVTDGGTSVRLLGYVPC